MNSAAGLVRLDRAPVGQWLTVHVAAGDAPPARHLANLGWRAGAPVRIIQATVAGGRVVDLDGGRVALSGQIARRLQVATGQPASR